MSHDVTCWACPTCGRSRYGGDSHVCLPKEPNPLCIECREPLPSYFPQGQKNVCHACFLKVQRRGDAKRDAALQMYDALEVMIATFGHHCGHYQDEVDALSYAQLALAAAQPKGDDNAE